MGLDNENQTVIRSKRTRVFDGASRSKRTNEFENQEANRPDGTRVFEKQEANRSKGAKECLRYRKQTARKGLELEWLRNREQTART